MAIRGIEVVGLNKTVRALQQFGVEVSDLKAAFKRVATTVADDAKSRVNSRTGNLAASIRAGNAKNKAIVRAGNARVPYAGVQEFGGYNNITPMQYLTGAAEDNESKSVRIIDEGIKQLISKYGLKI